MSCRSHFQLLCQGRFKYAKTQGDVALVSLVHIRFGVKAHCNGQACSNTFEVHAWQSDSAVETIERHCTSKHEPST